MTKPASKHPISPSLQKQGGVGVGCFFTAHNRLAANDSQYSYSLNHNGLLDSITTQQTNTSTFTHDANGHRTQKTGTQQGADNWVYDYNAQERLSEVKRNNITQATYKYNAQGQRIQKTTNTGTTFYLYNSLGLAAEYDQTGTLQKEYGYLPGQPYMTNPVFLRTSTGFAYYQNDHLGTPQRLVDKQGITVWQASYDAFGKATTSINTVENNLRFAGQYFDAESNLHQNWFRDYDPETGRYLERDPIGLNGGVNTYGYANANPVLFTDTTGEIGIYGGAVGVLAGYATSYMMGCDYDASDAAIDFAMGFVGANLGKMGNLRRAYHAGLNKAKDMGLTPYQAWGWRRGLGADLKSQTPGSSFIYKWNKWRYPEGKPGRPPGDELGPFFNSEKMRDVNKTLTDTHFGIDKIMLMPKSTTVSAGIPAAARSCACD